MQARCVFKNETQRYVLCPYCHQIHIHAIEHGTADRPANCADGQDGALTYTIAGNYSLREIATALASRNKMVDRKRAARKIE
jgi:hypothetical protein